MWNAEVARSSYQTWLSLDRRACENTLSAGFSKHFWGHITLGLLPGSIQVEILVIIQYADLRYPSSWRPNTKHPAPPTGQVSPTLEYLLKKRRNRLEGRSATIHPLGTQNTVDEEDLDEEGTAGPVPNCQNTSTGAENLQLWYGELRDQQDPMPG